MSCSVPAPRRYFGPARPNDACHWHRVVLPCRYAARDLGTRAELLCGDEPPPGPVYARQVHGLAQDKEIFDAAVALRRGAKVVWGLDDDFLTVPDWNPAKPPDAHLAAWHLMRRVAHHVVVSTPGLARTLGPDAPVLVAPNLIELDQYDAPDPVKDGYRLRILWAGSRTHARDVEVAVPAVRHVLQKYHRAVEVVWFGAPAPGELVRDFAGRGLVEAGGVQGFDLYHQTLNAIRPAVVLAPLLPCPFNESKSALRVMEGHAMCAAVAATPFGEYAAVRDGVDGILAPDADAWVDALDRLVTRPELRIRLAAAGRARAAAEYDWNNPACRTPWVDAFKAILDLS